MSSTTTGRSTRSRARGAAAPLLPLGALAAGFGLALLPMSGAVRAQAAATPTQVDKAAEATLPAVKVQATAEATGKAAYQAVTTTVGRGRCRAGSCCRRAWVITSTRC